MRLSISLGMTAEDWQGASAYVQEAERLGIHDVWSAEAWGYDAVTPLAFLAAKTSRIRLGSGIIQAGTRTPALVAMTASSLASMSSTRLARPSIASRILVDLGPMGGARALQAWMLPTRRTCWR